MRSCRRIVSLQVRTKGLQSTSRACAREGCLGNSNFAPSNSPPITDMRCPPYEHFTRRKNYQAGPIRLIRPNPAPTTASNREPDSQNRPQRPSFSIGRQGTLGPSLGQLRLAKQGIDLPKAHSALCTAGTAVSSRHRAVHKIIPIVCTAVCQPILAFLAHRTSQGLVIGVQTLLVLFVGLDRPMSVTCKSCLAGQ